MNSLKITILFTLSLGFSSGCFAQSSGAAEAKNMHYVIDKNEMTVTYDLPEPTAGKCYSVTLMIVDSQSYKKIYPKYIKGDVGNCIKGGQGKNIVWSINLDSIKISTKLGVFVTYELNAIKGGPMNALLSIPVPGLGDYFVSNSQVGFLFTIAAYGLVGYGLYENGQSSSSYQSYHESTDQTNINTYYDQANSQKKTAMFCIELGAAIWVADIAWVALKGAHNDKVKSKLLAYNPNDKGLHIGMNSLPVMRPAGGRSLAMQLAYRF